MQCHGPSVGCSFLSWLALCPNGHYPFSFHLFATIQLHDKLSISKVGQQDRWPDALLVVVVRGYSNNPALLCTALPPRFSLFRCGYPHDHPTKVPNHYHNKR